MLNYRACTAKLLQCSKKYGDFEHVLQNCRDASSSVLHDPNILSMHLDLLNVVWCHLQQFLARLIFRCAKCYPFRNLSWLQTYGT